MPEDEQNLVWADHDAVRADEFRTILTVPPDTTSGCCAVCLDDFTASPHGMMLECSHVFHKACIAEWFRTHRSCPVCRRPSRQHPQWAPPTASHYDSDEDYWKTRTNNCHVDHHTATLLAAEIG